MRLRGEHLVGLWAPMEGSGESDLPLPPGVWAHLTPTPRGARAYAHAFACCMRARSAPPAKNCDPLRAQRALSKNECIARAARP